MCRTWRPQIDKLSEKNTSKQDPAQLLDDMALVRFPREGGVSKRFGGLGQWVCSRRDGRCPYRFRCWVCRGFSRRLRFRFGEAVVVVVDCREGAEEEAADVGEDGGAAGRDVPFGEEMVEHA